jgi:hypothetical protein
VRLGIGSCCVLSYQKYDCQELEDGKAVLMAFSVTDGSIFVLLCYFLVVRTVKSLSSVVSSRFGGSEEAVADNTGFCAETLVPPWEQYTF